MSDGINSIQVEIDGEQKFISVEGARRLYFALQELFEGKPIHSMPNIMVGDYKAISVKMECDDDLPNRLDMWYGPNGPQNMVYDKYGNTDTL